MVTVTYLYFNVFLNWQEFLILRKENIMDIHATNISSAFYEVYKIKT